MGYIDHHIAHTYDRYAVADPEITTAEFRQAVEVINQVLGVVNALCNITGNAERFRALSSAGYNNRRRVEDFSKLIQRQIRRLTDLDVSKVMHSRVDQNLTKLDTHAFLELVLIEIDSVFNESAGFYVTIDNDNFMAGLGKFSNAINSGWTGADRQY